MDVEKIEKLINKEALTSEDKAAIREAAADAGLSTGRGRPCARCYERILLQLYELATTERRESLDGYVLKNVRTSIRACGILISNSTISGMRVEGLHRHIVSEFFEKKTDNDDTEVSD